MSRNLIIFFIVYVLYFMFKMFLIVIICRIVLDKKLWIFFVNLVSLEVYFIMIYCNNVFIYFILYFCYIVIFFLGDMVDVDRLVI